MVDDDQCDRRNVQRALGNRYGLVEAVDGPQAMRLVDVQTPDCILLDYHIPGTNSLELLDDLRLHAPVVMLTGAGDEAVAVAAMKAGALDYVSKNDFSADSLDLAIRGSIEKADRHRRQLESRERLQREYCHEKERRLELEGALEVAHDIQQHLLPADSPEIEGLDVAGVCIPAEATSGDFFDYLPGTDGTLGIVVGDVSGHGIGPALLAAETRAYILRADADRLRCRTDYDDGQQAPVGRHLRTPICHPVSRLARAGAQNCELCGGRSLRVHRARLGRLHAVGQPMPAVGGF